MQNANPYARSWGTNPLRESDQTLAVLDDGHTPRRMFLRSPAGRWVLGALALAATAALALLASHGLVAPVLGR